MNSFSSSYDPIGMPNKRGYSDFLGTSSEFGSPSSSDDYSANKRPKYNTSPSSNMNPYSAQLRAVGIQQSIFSNSGMHQPLTDPRQPQPQGLLGPVPQNQQHVNNNNQQQQDNLNSDQFGSFFSNNDNSVADSVILEALEDSMDPTKSLFDK